MFRVRDLKPPMGVGVVRYLDLPGVLRDPPQPRSTPLLRPFLHHGQMEGYRAGEDAGEPLMLLCFRTSAAEITEDRTILLRKFFRTCLVFMQSVVFFLF